MKKLVTLLFVAIFGLGVLGATGCGDPCTKLFDKMIDCTKDDKMKEAFKKDKDKMIKECKKDDKKKDKAKKCAKESDCEKMMKCLASD